MRAEFTIGKHDVDKIIEKYIREKHDFDEEQYTVEVKRNIYENSDTICVEVGRRA